MKQTADAHQYIALGVSNDDRMGDDLTFICKHGIFDDKSVSTFNYTVWDVMTRYIDWVWWCTYI